MVNRGRAVAKKKADKYRDAWFDSEGNEVSPPTSPERHEENRSKRERSRKLSSEQDRQESLNPAQSAREALVHLFDDLESPLNTPVDPVESSTALSSLLDTAPVDHAQAYKGPARQSESKSKSKNKSKRTTPAEELVRPQKKAPPKKSSRVQLPAPDSQASPSPAPSVQSFEQPSDTEAMANNFIPTGQHRNMRACMVCSIVKTQQQFLNHGCPNCGFLELRGNAEGIADCTSQVFEGLITVSDTSRSWVARWQRLEGYVPGVYAVQVDGVLPDEVIGTAEENGVHYIPRDGSVNEALPTDA